MTRLEETRPTGHGRARGLVSSRRSGRRVEARTYAPPAELAPVIEALWKGEWDLRGQAPHVTELLSDPCVHVVFERGSSRVVGVWTRLWSRTLEGRGRVRAAKIRAGAVRAFLAPPAASLTNRIVPLATLGVSDVAALEDAVLGPDDDHLGLAALTGWLRALRRSEGEALVRRAVGLMNRLAGDPALSTVDALARATRSTPRSLQRIFREHVGASPKWVLRRFRLQEAALRIERGDAPNLALLAAELGYADQAHLARDFKAAVGRNPSAFARAVAADAREPESPG